MLASTTDVTPHSVKFHTQVGSSSFVGAGTLGVGVGRVWGRLSPQAQPPSIIILDVPINISQFATTNYQARQVFERLAEEWRRDSRFMSSTLHMAMLPSYQAIIGMGPIVVPWILARLRNDLDHWFWALEAITRENPVPNVVRGQIKQMAEAWLAWGQKKGQIQ